MKELLPGILATTPKQLKEQLDRVKWAPKIHIDIMDGKFVKTKTIQALTLKKYLPKAQLQIHLMASKPHKYIKTYSRLGAAEFIIHSEATEHPCETLEDIRLAGMKSGLAFNPKTKIGHHAHSLVHADLALVMTVHPGLFGQTFLKTPLHKIEEIKKINPLIRIGLDGGVNLSNARHASAADFCIATSAVTLTPNPKESYQELLDRICHQAYKSRNAR